MEPPPGARLLELLMGKLVSQTICAAAELGIADALGDEPARSHELATIVKADPSSLYRLMRALTVVGVFCEVEHGLFEHTPLSRALRADAPVSMRPTALLVASEWHWRPWTNLANSVRTGTAGFDAAFGMGMFEYLAGHPEAAQVFDAAMTSLADVTNAALLAAYDFSGSRVVADVGGGQGRLLLAILHKTQDLNGILFDSPHVLGAARRLVQLSGLESRCRLVEGSFFESVPGGADTYILKHILHDWPDERAVTILENCAKQVPHDGKLLVVERLVTPELGPNVAKLLDLDMLILMGGRERTEREMSDLFTAAGLRLARIVPTPMGINILEAWPCSRVG